LLISRRIFAFPALSRSGLANLWHMEKFPWHAVFTAASICFVSFTRPASLFCEEHMYIYTHVCHYVEFVPLVPNNTASETFLCKSGAVRSVDWIFIFVAPAWR
jgi:hypothetical protein